MDPLSPLFKKCTMKYFTYFEKFGKEERGKELGLSLDGRTRCNTLLACSKGLVI